MFSCTIFCITSDSDVFVGNNEDWFYSSKSTIKMVPSKKGEFARIEFLNSIVPNYVQGGMNEKGLFYDGAGTPSDKIKLKKSTERVIPAWLFNSENILKKYSTVDEVVNYISKINFKMPMEGHIFLADASGKAVVLEWVNGDLIVIEKEKQYLIATNYLISKPGLLGGGLDREKVFQEKFKLIEKLDIDHISNLLKATSQKGEEIGTLYSYICDLKKRTMTIFLYADQTKMITYNFDTDMKKMIKMNINDIFSK